AEVAANPRVGEGGEFGFPELPVVAQGNAEERKAQADRLLSEGIRLRQEGQFQESLDKLQQALVIYREIGVREAFPQESRSGEGTTLSNLGNVYLSLGQYPKAIEFYQQALFIHREVGNRAGEGTTLNNLGLVYDNLGQYPQAIEYYQQALFIHREVGNRAVEGTTLNNLGTVYNSLGQYPKAIEFYEQALFIHREVGDRSGEGGTFNNLGEVYRSLGQYPQAIEFYQQALAIMQELGNRSGEGTTLSNLGNVYLSLGQYPKAIEFYQQALSIRREVGDRSGEGTTLNNLGEVYRNLGQYPKAIEFYQQALSIRRELGNRAVEGTTLNNLGNVYLSLGQYPKALEFYQQALFIHREVGDRSGEGTTLNNLGVVYLSLGQYPEAEKYFFDAIVVWESLRPSELSDEDKISIFDTQAYTYRLLQRVLIAQNKIETALEISERGRARAFVELMAQRQQGDSSEEFVPPAPPTLADIQQVAREQNATLVEYAVLDDETLYIWVISPDGNIAFRQQSLTDIDLPSLVTTTRQALGVRNANAPYALKPGFLEELLANRERQLTQLHQLLIEPIADLLPKTPEERVIFVPHSELFLVPFPALQDANGTDLIDKHTILTAPAIQVLQLAQRPNPLAPFPSREGGESPSPRRGGVGEGSDLLVVGNPVMPSISLNPGEPPVQLSSLPGAETEAKQIAQLLGTEPLLGNAATEPAVVERMQTARIVHLATHGILDDEGGIGSSIALTPEIGGEQPFAPTDSDGFLTAQEILGLNLNADLVVLSACDTGRGKITGDGVVGLSRSLLTAGVSSLVVSLWQVPDAPTAQLMTRFYENLQQGLDKATALRNAMLETRATHPDPVNWAAFTLIGETD
ncbi:MAG: CHAT domain-containing tetratricopeptide repeat protein, partial [Geitlerinemataceae cyanobacterium]